MADGQVTRDFEVQEAIAFADGAEQSLADLSSDLLDEDPPATRALLAKVSELQVDLKNATAGTAVKDPEEIQSLSNGIIEAGSMFP